MTHVSERNGAGSSPTGAGGDRQPWTAGAGRQARKRSVSYADAGVSIDAGDRAVELLKSKVRQTRRPEVMGDLGGFAGLFRLDTKKYKSPILASSTDGVGTKLVIAQQMDIHDTVGIDLVAMVVDDLVACGAEPLFLLDYIATGEVVPDKVAEIGAGIADGCRYAGCALLGGETAEHPGVLRPDEYDISATGVGVVEEADILSPDRVEVGDVVIAMRSSGLHSNGYSLVRHVLLGAARMRLDIVIDDFGRQRTLGEELLTPTKIYAKDCLKLIAEAEVRALSHITGGGIPGNLVRVLPEHVDAVVNRSTWKPQPIFDLIQSKGRIDDQDMESTFNMGVGMFAIVSAEDADRALATLTGRGVEAWQAGEIIEGTGNVQMVGQHTRG
ncbi:phosphoribosylformylglycinamidine cyclo-ligase [Micromonospora zamorensis]|uniref:Phosphoribosylformylglycinamidine cyclo-ligase n=2 Tax=Micromonospora TaxID=1873 RepID=A0A7Y9X4M6_9ACTN|nr:MULTISPECIES: phosphoribosylformylglycinamidine cyclo-ligase [Micromonospora]NYH44317.1 phosphoribosylformylglycinamidine cyclo-ligase [Micromonospora jinlongensis]MBQ0978537.1 phosphoribosylformylglycinamidine cyclo-ligase [Micromonospora sp. M61]MBQ1036237.1 phosphoribosylformylglycinamidine cyclo-ligase [Micromonospora sp. C81]TQJ26078.1 phosphoribosylformylglycinamidine cyclo-ligase [Micromonospora sp. A202]WSK45962.1 phosphoribosylformylglycinamidine cyclo-ligase [Micromonospora zamore